MKKAYGVLTKEYFVGYVYSETTGKAKSFALNSRLETDGYEFTDLLVYRCKALDSVFPKLSINTLDPTENDDVKILKDIGLCVGDTFHCDVQIRLLPKTEEITEEMINEFMNRVLTRVRNDKPLSAAEYYQPLHILERIEKHKDIFVIKLYSHETESEEDEVLIYGSKNSALKDTMDFINQQKSYNMDAGIGLEPTTS